MLQIRTLYLITDHDVTKPLQTIAGKLGIELSRLEDPCDITEKSMCVAVVLFDLTENYEVVAHRYRPEVVVFIMAWAELKKAKIKQIIPIIIPKSGLQLNGVYTGLDNWQVVQV